MIWRFAPDHVVIKPVFGFNQHGVLLLDHGVDRITGSKIAGRKDVVAYHRRSGLLGPATRKEGAVLNSTRTSLGQAVQMRGKVMAEQQRILHSWCSARGLSVDRQYEDWAPSTEYSLEERPGLHLLLQDIIQKILQGMPIEL